MAEKVRIIVDIEDGFTQDSYLALKAMLDAYVGEFIKANSAQTSNNPYGNRRFDNDIKFTVNFVKMPPEPLEYQQ